MKSCSAASKSLESTRTYRSAGFKSEGTGLLGTDSYDPTVGLHARCDADEIGWPEKYIYIQLSEVLQKMLTHNINNNIIIDIAINLGTKCHIWTHWEAGQVPVRYSDPTSMSTHPVLMMRSHQQALRSGEPRIPQSDYHYILAIWSIIIVLDIIILGLSLLQSIPPTTAKKQTHK